MDKKMKRGTSAILAGCVLGSMVSPAIANPMPIIQTIQSDNGRNSLAIGENETKFELTTGNVSNAGTDRTGVTDITLKSNTGNVANLQVRYETEELETGETQGIFVVSNIPDEVLDLTIEWNDDGEEPYDANGVRQKFSCKWTRTNAEASWGLAQDAEVIIVNPQYTRQTINDVLNLSCEYIGNFKSNNDYCFVQTEKGVVPTNNNTTQIATGINTDETKQLNAIISHYLDTYAKDGKDHDIYVRTGNTPESYKYWRVGTIEQYRLLIPEETELKFELGAGASYANAECEMEFFTNWEDLQSLPQVDINDFGLSTNKENYIPSGEFSVKTVNTKTDTVSITFTTTKKESVEATTMYLFQKNSAGEYAYIGELSVSVSAQVFRIEIDPDQTVTLEYAYDAADEDVAIGELNTTLMNPDVSSPGWHETDLQLMKEETTTEPSATGISPSSESQLLPVENITFSLKEFTEGNPSTGKIQMEIPKSVTSGTYHLFHNGEDAGTFTLQQIITEEPLSVEFAVDQVFAISGEGSESISIPYTCNKDTLPPEFVSGLELYRVDGGDQKIGGTPITQGEGNTLVITTNFLSGSIEDAQSYQYKIKDSTGKELCLFTVEKEDLTIPNEVPGTPIIVDFVRLSSSVGEEPTEEIIVGTITYEKAEPFPLGPVEGFTLENKIDGSQLVATVTALNDNTLKIEISFDLNEGVMSLNIPVSGEYVLKYKGKELATITLNIIEETLPTIGADTELSMVYIGAETMVMDTIDITEGNIPFDVTYAKLVSADTSEEIKDVEFGTYQNGKLEITLPNTVLEGNYKLQYKGNLLDTPITVSHKVMTISENDSILNMVYVGEQTEAVDTITLDTNISMKDASGFSLKSSGEPFVATDIMLQDSNTLQITLPKSDYDTVELFYQDMLVGTVTIAQSEVILGADGELTLEYEYNSTHDSEAADIITVSSESNLDPETDGEKFFIETNDGVPIEAKISMDDATNIRIAMKKLDALANDTVVLKYDGKKLGVLTINDTVAEEPLKVELGTDKTLSLVYESGADGSVTYKDSIEYTSNRNLTDVSQFELKTQTGDEVFGITIAFGVNKTLDVTVPNSVKSGTYQMFFDGSSIGEITIEKNGPTVTLGKDTEVGVSFNDFGENEPKSDFIDYSSNILLTDASLFRVVSSGTDDDVADMVVSIASASTLKIQITDAVENGSYDLKYDGQVIGQIMVNKEVVQPVLMKNGMESLAVGFKDTDTNKKTSQVELVTNDQAITVDQFELKDSETGIAVNEENCSLSLTGGSKNWLMLHISKDLPSGTYNLYHNGRVIGTIEVTVTISAVQKITLGTDKTLSVVFRETDGEDVTDSDTIDYVSTLPLEDASSLVLRKNGYPMDSNEYSIDVEEGNKLRITVNAVIDASASYSIWYNETEKVGNIVLDKQIMPEDAIITPGMDNKLVLDFRTSDSQNTVNSDTIDYNSDRPLVEHDLEMMRVQNTHGDPVDAEILIGEEENTLRIRMKKSILPGKYQLMYAENPIITFTVEHKIFNDNPNLSIGSDSVVAIVIENSMAAQDDKYTDTIDLVTADAIMSSLFELRQGDMVIDNVEFSQNNGILNITVPGNIQGGEYDLYYNGHLVSGKVTIKKSSPTVVVSGIATVKFNQFDSDSRTASAMVDYMADCVLTDSTLFSLHDTDGEVVAGAVLNIGTQENDGKLVLTVQKAVPSGVYHVMYDGENVGSIEITQVLTSVIITGDTEVSLVFPEGAPSEALATDTVSYVIENGTEKDFDFSTVTLRKDGIPVENTSVEISSAGCFDVSASKSLKDGSYDLYYGEYKFGTVTISKEEKVPNISLDENTVLSVAFSENAEADKKEFGKIAYTSDVRLYDAARFSMQKDGLPANEFTFELGEDNTLIVSVTNAAVAGKYTLFYNGVEVGTVMLEKAEKVAPFTLTDDRIVDLQFPSDSPDAYASDMITCTATGEVQNSMIHLKTKSGDLVPGVMFYIREDGKIIDVTVSNEVAADSYDVWYDDVIVGEIQISKREMGNSMSMNIGQTSIILEYPHYADMQTVASGTIKIKVTNESEPLKMEKFFITGTNAEEYTIIDLEKTEDGVYELTISRPYPGEMYVDELCVKYDTLVAGYLNIAGTLMPNMDSTIVHDINAALGQLKGEDEENGVPPTAELPYNESYLEDKTLQAAAIQTAMQDYINQVAQVEGYEHWAGATISFLYDINTDQFKSIIMLRGTTSSAKVWNVVMGEKPADPEKPSVNVSNIELMQGSTYKMTLDFGAGTSEAKSATITVADSNTATVSKMVVTREEAAGGVVITGINPGTTKITITFDDIDNTTHEVNVKVSRVSYHVDVITNGSSYGSVTPSVPFDGSLYEGESITFTITPKAGYKIDKVLLNGVSQTLDGNKISIENISQNHKLEVVFVPDGNIHELPSVNYDAIKQYVSKSTTVRASFGLGVHSSTSATVFVKDPNIATVDTSRISNGSPEFTVTGRKAGKTTIVLTFNNNAHTKIEIPVTIQSSSSGGGSGSSSGGSVSYKPQVFHNNGGTVTVGSDNRTIKITPSNGYRIADVKINGKSVGVVTEYKLSSVSSSNKVEVIFEKISIDGNFGNTNPGGSSGSIGSSQFTDVAGHWAAEAINYMAERGWVNGVGNGRFVPDMNMTRAMFVTILSRMEGKSTGETVSYFIDVPQDSYYAEHVKWASEVGIVNGTGNYKFNPDRNITREEMAVMVNRYLEYKGIFLENGSNEFADSNKVDTWASVAVEKLGKAGIVNGKNDGKFDPKDFATRAELVMILYRVMQTYL